ncbi:MAG TPA: FAD-dependent oxidoreductase, partial [Herpetosiphonaceae bacterium]
MNELRFDIAVAGAGPAGLAAAAAAASRGTSVALLDDNPLPGGQIWRGGAEQAPSAEAGRVFAAAQAAGIRLLAGTRLLAPLGDGRL